MTRARERRGVPGAARDPLVKSHESFAAEITAIRKQVIKLQKQLEGPR